MAELKLTLDADLSSIMNQLKKVKKELAGIVTDPIKIKSEKGNGDKDSKLKGEENIHLLSDIAKGVGITAAFWDALKPFFNIAKMGASLLIYFIIKILGWLHLLPTKEDVVALQKSQQDALAQHKQALLERLNTPLPTNPEVSSLFYEMIHAFQVGNVDLGKALKDFTEKKITGEMNSGIDIFKRLGLKSPVFGFGERNPMTTQLTKAWIGGGWDIDAETGKLIQNTKDSMTSVTNIHGDKLDNIKNLTNDKLSLTNLIWGNNIIDIATKTKDGGIKVSNENASLWDTVGTTTKTGAQLVLDLFKTMFLDMAILTSYRGKSTGQTGPGTYNGEVKQIYNPNTGRWEATKSTKVSDAIITKTGQVVRVDPNDTLIATKKGFGNTVSNTINMYGVTSTEMINEIRRIMGDEVNRASRF